jgi:radical SAM protein with 4Fe4S-binding SPASM domain
MAIAPDGEVVPCQSWLNNEAGLGNMLTDKWENIWNNEKCRKIRNYATKSTGKCPLREGGVSI